HVQTTSPTVDAGDPGSYYLGEPVPNGGRVDLGAYGNTAETVLSAFTQVQVVSPGNLDKLQVGQPATIQVQTAGLTSNRPIALMNAGGGTVDNWLYDNFQTGASIATTETTTHAIDTTGVSDPAPQGVYQAAAVATSGVGNELAYRLP